MKKAMLEANAKVSPESLTAQIRGLNELTESLSNYLKEHCETKVKEKEEEIAADKTALTEQVATLESRIADKEQQHQDLMEAQSADYTKQLDDLNTKI